MSDELLVATVVQGKIQGQVEIDHENKPYLSFYGIPYAKPPVGNLRFKDPVSPDPWTGVRDGSKEKGPCYSMQLNLSDSGSSDGPKLIATGSEDCLYLNLFTRKLRANPNEALKPVMVWIHGGAFTTGSGARDTHGPEFLLAQDIVLVVVEYRAGALGFLSIEEEGIGNAGLKDIVQALKWVKENISKFSGHPNNVTIFGESAGGSAVEYLILSPLAKGLFHRAIAQSGSALNPWARGQQNNAHSLASILGFENKTDLKGLLEFLQGLSKEEILDGQRKLGDHLSPERVRFFSPTIERPSNSAFISEEPVKLIRSGRFNEVPLIMGYTSQEGMMAHYLENLGLAVSSTDFVPHFLGLKKDDENYEKTRRQISKFYWGADVPDTENNNTALYTAVTDTLFLRGVYASVRAYAKSSSLPIYLYKFTADTRLNIMKAMLKTNEPGVCHADDLGYIFKPRGMDDLPHDSVEYRTSAKVVKLWTNFARHGNPTPAVDDDLDQVVWEPVHGEQINFLEIDSTLKTDVDPEPERMKFWDDVLKTVPGY